MDELFLVKAVKMQRPKLYFLVISCSIISQCLNKNSVLLIFLPCCVSVWEVYVLVCLSWFYNCIILFQGQKSIRWKCFLGWVLFGEFVGEGEVVGWCLIGTFLREIIIWICVSYSIWCHARLTLAINSPKKTAHLTTHQNAQFPDCPGRALSTCEGSGKTTPPEYKYHVYRLLPQLG